MTRVPAKAQARGTGVALYQRADPYSVRTICEMSSGLTREATAPSASSCATVASSAHLPAPFAYPPGSSNTSHGMHGDRLAGRTHDIFQTGHLTGTRRPVTRILRVLGHPRHRAPRVSAGPVATCIELGRHPSPAPAIARPRPALAPPRRSSLHTDFARLRRVHNGLPEHGARRVYGGAGRGGKLFFPTHARAFHPGVIGTRPVPG